MQTAPLSSPRPVVVGEGCGAVFSAKPKGCIGFGLRWDNGSVQPLGGCGVSTFVKQLTQQMRVKKLEKRAD